MKSIGKKSHKWSYALLLTLACTPFAVMASGSVEGLSDIITNITGIFKSLEGLIIGICYVAGIGFAAAGIMKFKQHKDNPSQVTLGGPIAMIFIAAALLWLPAIIKSTGQTVFNDGSGKNAGSASGGSIFSDSK